MGKGGGGGYTTYEYYQDAFFLVCRGPMKRLRRMWWDKDVVYDDRPEQVGWHSRPITADGRRPKLANYLTNDNVHVFLGTQTQGTWAQYEAAIGTENCPAMRGRMCLGLKSIPLHLFGGRLPTIEVEVESADADANGKSTLVFILNDVMDAALFPGSDFREFSELNGILVDGFQLANRAEARQHLQPLQDAFMFDLYDADFAVRAKLRGGSAIGTVQVEHMGAGTPDPQPQLFELTRGQEIDKPQRADVLYQSAAIDYQNFTQSTSKDSTLQRGILSINLPVVMGEDPAMAVARKSLALKQLNDGLKLCLPPRYISWCPGDLVHVQLPPDPTLYLFKCVRQLLGIFGHIEFTFQPDDPDIYTLTGEGSAPPDTGSGTVQEAYPPVIYVGDLTALLPGVADQSFDGCNVIVVIGSARQAWPGASSIDSQYGVRQYPGGQYTTRLTSHTLKGTIGTLTNTLGKWRGDNVWDDDNTLTVQLKRILFAAGDPAGTNRGNATLVMSDPSVAGGAFTGTYQVLFTDATHFTVYDPSNAVVGTGTTGHEFANEICFTITAGSTAMVSGDVFNILVQASGAVAGYPPVGVTDLQVLDGANALVVENEIVQFASVLDLGNNVFQLSRLLRGRCGTEHIAWFDHSPGATVAFLPHNSKAVQRFQAALSEAGHTHEIHAVDADKAGATWEKHGLGPSNTPYTTLTLAANCRKPWSPGAVELARSGNDLVIGWQHRSRWGDVLGDGGDGSVPLGESVEKYDVEIWNSTFTSLKRTTTGVTTNTWTYTDAMQVTDWGSSPHSPIGLVLYQFSPLVGQGFPRRVIVTI